MIHTTARLTIAVFGCVAALQAEILEGEHAGIAFWLAGVSGASRAVYRAGQTVRVKFCPDDQFCYEVKIATTLEGCS